MLMSFPGTPDPEQQRTLNPKQLVHAADPTIHALWETFVLFLKGYNIISMSEKVMYEVVTASVKWGWG